ncbi:hypothetical protein BD289DRAFT_25472 [Coniella lustricola]|uniref:Transcription factor domain-containing protein n=1 Tax=Coniella lustricola TaxID=2025994 RepID=A0A2T3A335_9PEZI|nr:hypothetical protein BD289DRAFT_25472 [Coniella lustricola]
MGQRLCCLLIRQGERGLDYPRTSPTNSDAHEVRCVRSDAARGSPCDRCKRLGKECAIQVHLPRKKRTASARNSKTSQLEERLNGLVELIRGSTEIPDSSRKRTPSLVPGPPMQSTSSNTPSTGAGGVINVPSSWNSSCPPRCICAATHGEVYLSAASDEDSFAYYQMRLLARFPFVVIPAQTKADQCKAERPLLFAAMKMAASVYNVSSMRAQMYQLVAQISQQVLISSNKSMDALQALLVMLGWFHNHCIMHAQMSSLLHLAQALLSELGLSREPAVQERTSIMVLMPAQPPPRKAEDKRALLGVWFLTSFAYTTLQRTLPMKFSRYMKTCLKELEETPEVASDQLLVHLVKIQRLTEHVHNRVSQEDEDDLISSIPRPPFSAFQGTFDAEIQRLKQSVPPSLKDNKLLRIHYASAILRVYQPPPTEYDVLQALVSSFDNSSIGGLTTIESFHKAKAALTGFFDAYLSLPVEFYNVMPVYTMTQIIWGITMLARWANLMGPGRARSKTANDLLNRHKVIWDPSAQRPQASTACEAGVAPQTSHQEGHVCALAKAGSPSYLMSASGNDPVDDVVSRLRHLPPSFTHPTQISATHIREAADPKIPRVIAALKARLQPQRDLNLDIVDIMAKLGNRVEEVHRMREDRFLEGWQNDIWHICSKKILIARAKLEKFAELIDAPTASRMQPKHTQERDCDEAMDAVSLTTATNNGHGSTQGQPAGGLADTQGNDQASSAGGFNLSTLDDAEFFDGLWMGSAFDPLDPSLWLTDDLDWSAPLLPEATQETDTNFS